MANPIAGMIGASLGSSLLGSRSQKRAAQSAAQAQAAGNQASIEEQRRQFDQVQKILSPYVNAGTSALYGTAPQSPTALAQAQANAQQPQPTESFNNQLLNSQIASVESQLQTLQNSRPNVNMSRMRLPDRSALENWRGRVNDLTESLTNLRGLQDESQKSGTTASPVPGMVAGADGQAAGGAGGGGLFDYINTGRQAFEQQMALAGLGTPEEEQAQIDRLMERPGFQEMMNQGESAILQNAAATGGVRGGDTQRALMSFRPQLLNQAINQQYGRLGGLASTGLSTALDVTRLGQSSAAGQAGAAQTTGANISQALQSTGTAQANAALQRGAANSGVFNSIGNLGGMALGRGLQQGAFDKILGF